MPKLAKIGQNARHRHDAMCAHKLGFDRLPNSNLCSTHIWHLEGPKVAKPTRFGWIFASVGGGKCGKRHVNVELESGQDHQTMCYDASYGPNTSPMGCGEQPARLDTHLCGY